MELKKTDIQKYSIRGLIDSVARCGAPSGFEAELHAQAEKENGQRASGVVIPWQILTRDLMNAGTFGQGGGFVQTSIGGLVELLRNSCACIRLGATTLTGIRGNLALPRQTSAATAYSLPESGTTPTSTQTIDQIVLTPQRVSASTEFSRELQLQSSVDIEEFIGSDLRRVLSTKWDGLMLATLLGTDGAGSVTFGGAATWAKVLAFETALASMNAILPDSRLGYLSSPTVRAAWKNIPKIAASSFPIFLWEAGQFQDAPDDALVNGFRAAVTNQIGSTNQVFFGDWRSLIFATWGAGPDVIINPYSRDTDAVTRLTMHTFCATAVRHAQSFAISADSGAQ